MAIPPPPTTYVCPITKKLMKVRSKGLTSKKVYSRSRERLTTPCIHVSNVSQLYTPLTSFHPSPLQEPVRSRHGRQHYERYAIMEWMESGNHFCPVTGTLLVRSHLVPNKTLQWKIDSWASDNGGGQTSVDEDETPSCVHASTSTPGNLRRARHHEPPQRFHCPLSRTMMVDPVVTAEGINFERTVILEWLEVNESCPVTGKPLLPSELITNETLRREIDLWCAIHMDTTSGGNITLIDGQRPMCDSTSKRRQSSMSSTSSLSLSLSSSSSSSSSISSMLSSSSMGLLLGAAATRMVPPVHTGNKTVATSSSSLTTMLRALPPITGECYRGTRTGRSSSSSTSSAAFEAIGKTSLIAAINDALEFSAIQIHD